MIEPILAPTPKELDDIERLFTRYRELFETLARNCAEELRAFQRGTLLADSPAVHSDHVKIDFALRPVRAELEARVAAAPLRKRLAEIQHEVLNRVWRPLLEEASRAKR